MKSNNNRAVSYAITDVSLLVRKCPPSLIPQGYMKRVNHMVPCDDTGSLLINYKKQIANVMSESNKITKSHYNYVHHADFYFVAP